MSKMLKDLPNFHIPTVSYQAKLLKLSLTIPMLALIQQHCPMEISCLRNLTKNTIWQIWGNKPLQSGRKFKEIECLSHTNKSCKILTNS